VHELPDFAYFSHKKHVAAEVTCEKCHGNVAQMERIEQKGALTMGWCLNCHKGETAPHAVLAKKYPNMKNPKGPVAPIQCSTCHY
jgi:hypothetical protein